MFDVNTYLVTDPATGASAIIDTGESDELVRRLEALEPAPDIQMILLTHTHLDHAGALTMLQERWDVPTYMPAKDRPLFETLPMQGTMFGMPHLNRPCGRIDHEIHDGDTVQLGEATLRFLSTPGHTPGQGCWFDDEDIVVGDTLFSGSIGRTDFPFSDPQLMVESLRRLMALPGHLRVHSGHGPVTTLSEEL
jgi:hydroxyacylglutathione hydrolase